MQQPVTPCTVCESTDVRRFLLINNIPVFCNVQWPSRQEALDAPSGDIDLGYCGDCGHIFNTRFDDQKLDYSASYENSLHFSPHFQEHAEQLVERLISKFNIRDKKIIEIGCGKGEFISMMCEAGNNTGYGFDASYEEERESRATSGSVTFIKDFYDSRYEDIKADMITCRHVLEHIQHPVEFLRGIRATIDSDVDGVVYFEVPNSLYSIDDMGIWDFIYEHCSYFCLQSAKRAFADAGFCVTDAYTDFGNQFLCVEAKLGNADEGFVADAEYLAKLGKTIESFGQNYLQKVDYWNKELSAISKKGGKVALWGAGSKGVTFLNCIDSADAIESVVDINPNKKGLFVSGTGQEIVSPADLASSPPNYVIIMNALYKSEISKTLQQMGIEATLLCA